MTCDLRHSSRQLDSRQTPASADYHGAAIHIATISDTDEPDTIFARINDDPSYLPELRDYLDTLLRDRERIRSAIELDEWARAEAMPSEDEITRLRQLIRRVEHDLDSLTDGDRQQIEEAVRVVRRTRQTVHLGLPRTTPPTLDPQLESDRP